MTSENLKEAPIVQRIAYNNGVDFSFRPVNRSDFYYGNKEGASLDPNSVASVLQSVAFNAVNHKGHMGSLRMLQYIKGAKQNLTEGRVLPCTAGSHSFFLDLQ